MLLVGFFFCKAFFFNLDVLVEIDSLSLGLCASAAAAAATAGDIVPLLDGGAGFEELEPDGPASMLPSLLISLPPLLG